MVNGSIKQTETEFTVSYDLLNTKLSHSMELGEGDTIAVALLSDKGRIDVLVTDPDGDTVYQGNDASTGSFTLEITKAGAYTFSVTGKGAKGSFSFIVNK
jgi:hypothetical protein